MGKGFYFSNFLFLVACVVLFVVIFSVHALEEDGKVKVHDESYTRKHAIKTIQSEDGDIIDCVDIYKQPAFDRPALKNHRIQMKPSYEIDEEDPPQATKRKSEKHFANMTVTQLWQKSGKCPEATVPIRRNQEKQLLHSRKKHMHHHAIKHLNDHTEVSLQQPNFSQAILLTMGYNYAGVKGDIKVWNPHVELKDDYTFSLVRLKSGPYYDFESIEFGWTVHPDLYGDGQTRLSIYWTLDASKTTGCFDLTCPGFVQTSSEIALGTPIYPISDVFHPSAITVFIFRDPTTDNLWVQYGEKINIGYWPASMFSSLSHGAEAAEWGGEVHSAMVGGRTPHTATQMGNGHYPDIVFGYSGMVTRIRVLDISLNLKFPEWVYPFADEFRCYDVFYNGDYVEDPEFYYGGPGRYDGFCP